MKNTEYFVVRLYVGPPTRKRLDLLDQARRQCDHLGRPGIEAKRRATNRRYRRKGYVRLRFPNRRLARAYVARLEALGEPALRWRLMRNRSRYR